MTVFIIVVAILGYLLCGIVTAGIINVPLHESNGAGAHANVFKSNFQEAEGIFYSWLAILLWPVGALIGFFWGANYVFGHLSTWITMKLAGAKK